MMSVMTSSSIGLAGARPDRDPFHGQRGVTDLGELVESGRQDGVLQLLTATARTFTVVDGR
jgi:hypothetical protein